MKPTIHEAQSAARVVKPLPLRALYSAAALARCVGISRPRMLRLLRAQRAVVYKVGRGTFVPLTEIQEKLQPLWESIRAAEQVRAAAAHHTGRVAGRDIDVRE
jgi:hypothetical protein